MVKSDSMESNLNYVRGGDVLKRIAVISDVHGNSFALESVKDDMASRKIDTIVNLGDSVFGPIDPAGTADILIEMKCISISGNQDRVLVSPTEDVQKSPTFHYVKEKLTNHHMDWLNSLPGHITIDEDIFLCHGTPTSDETYLLENVTPNTVELRDEKDIASHLGQCNLPIVLCGHSHIPRLVSLTSGPTVINPGSVGLPAFDDDAPYFHRMQTGSPHARYCVLTKDNNRWSMEQISLEYDWEKAAALAQTNGRPDWARALRTGRA